MKKIHGMIRDLESEKEKENRIFSSLREISSSKISSLQRQLDEFFTAKASYDKFAYTDLSAIKVASYALHTLINILETLKDNWKK